MMLSIVCDKADDESALDATAEGAIDANASIRCFCRCTLFRLLCGDVDELKLLLLRFDMWFAFDMQLLPNDATFSSDSASRGDE